MQTKFYSFTQKLRLKDEGKYEEQIDNLKEQYDDKSLKKPKIIVKGYGN